jgi:hypothetical protein
MGENPVLFLLFANDCGACKAFKQGWDPARQLKEELKREFVIIERNVATYRQQLNDSSLPYHISHSVPHFPMMGVFPANAWKIGMSDTSKPYHLNGELWNMNTELDGRFTSQKPGKYASFELSIFKKWALESKALVMNRPMPTIQATTPVVNDQNMFCARRVPIKPTKT